MISWLPPYIGLHPKATAIADIHHSVGPKRKKSLNTAVKNQLAKHTSKRTRKKNGESFGKALDLLNY